MYRLLVVDDERWVRQGLCLTIDWAAEGITLIGEAEDGEEALARIEAESPDLIITDIKMPRMDGLDLMEAVKNRPNKTYVIIISGYNDFEYAQKALKYGAYDYVLKPIEETALLEVVRRCVIDLDREKARRRQLTEMSGRIRASLPLARQHFLEMLLGGYAKEPTSGLEARWHDLSLTLKPDQLIVAAVKIHDWGPKSAGEQDRSWLRYALGNIAEETMNKRRAVACMLDHHADADLVVIFSADPPAQRPGKEREPGIASELMEAIGAAKRYLGIVASAGFSGTGNLSTLPQRFLDALSACYRAFREGFGKAYEAASLPAGTGEANVTIVPDGSWETKLCHAMKLGDTGAVAEWIEQLTHQLQAAGDQHSPLQIARGLRQLLHSVGKKWEAAHPYRTAPGIDRYNDAVLGKDIPFAELGQRLRDVLQQCAAEAQGSGHRARIVELGMQFTHLHYMEGITMNDTAEHLYLNPSYFSKVFHEATGETYSKYVIRLRMNKAKQLLKTSRLKVYEIAEKVGYADFRHFSKTFKEIEGMTPAQYRDLGV
ncbi:response regulator transcription factor [Paenibacillus arenilitoris]|uniref:Response regulator n=1 Tax=Paenibacillus arenilitoris TaxID=2772299 RepID=A0A927CS86_9BACL|nr:response regulator [Paenibacillus arenilitoris]MBD2871943.1 response regulator [Paenibacillus arenilitoris]